MVLLDDRVVLNQDKYLLTSLTKACSLQGNSTIRTRLPIQKGMLKILLSTLQVQFATQPYLKLLYSALFSTAYFGLFQVGELTLGDHPVKAKDVHITMNKNKLMFILHTSKTHWTDNQPQVIKISSKDFDKKNKKLFQLFSSETSERNSGICPYQILRDYLIPRPYSFHTVNEPFFVFRDRAPVTPRHMRTVLKSCLESSEFTKSCYDTHSFRAGRSVDLLHMKIPVPVIKKLGRWHSNSVYRYLNFH